MAEEISPLENASWWKERLRKDAKSKLEERIMTDRSAALQTSWERHRFKANYADPRPIVFPPPGPYWISGYGDGYSIVIAYLPKGTLVTDFWPEAKNIDSTEEDSISFTSRFPQPTWWQTPTTYLEANIKG